MGTPKLSRVGEKRPKRVTQRTHKQCSARDLGARWEHTGRTWGPWGQPPNKVGMKVSGILPKSTGMGMFWEIFGWIFGYGKLCFVHFGNRPHCRTFKSPSNLQNDRIMAMGAGWVSLGIPRSREGNCELTIPSRLPLGGFPWGSFECILEAGYFGCVLGWAWEGLGWSASAQLW